MPWSYALQSGRAWGSNRDLLCVAGERVVFGLDAVVLQRAAGLCFPLLCREQLWVVQVFLAAVCRAAHLTSRRVRLFYLPLSGAVG